jgi:hypothetical protein
MRRPCSVAGQSQEGTSLTELVHILFSIDRSPHFLPEGGNENSPGWSVAQSGEGVPTVFSRPVGPRRTSTFPLDHVHAIVLNSHLGGGAPGRTLAL